MNISGNDIAWDMIRLAMSSSAVLAIFPIQDVLRLDSSHRMNIPSTSSSNWQFRFELAQLREDDTRALKYLSELFNRIPEEEKEEAEEIVAEKVVEEKEVVSEEAKERNNKRTKRGKRR